MKRGLYLLLLIPLLVSFPTSLPAEKGVSPKEWTVLVYMNGDNSLEGEVINDINEMERVGSGSNLNIVVEVDRTPGYDDSWGDWTDTRRYFILPDGGSSKLSSLRMDNGLGEINMADPQALKDFLQWGFETFPARHYMVILWDHGTGIFRYSRSTSISGTRGVSSDITSGEDMEMKDAASALGEAMNEVGIPKMDIIGFDLCSLGQIETAYQFSPYSNYMVASFDEEPSPGWNYTTFLSPFLHSSLSPEMLAKRAVESYRNEYRDGNEYKSLIAVNITSLLKNAFPRFNDLSRAIYDLNYSCLLEIGKIRDESHHPWRKEIYKDLGDLLFRINTSDRLPEGLKKRAGELRQNISKAILDSFLGKIHPSTAFGLGIYFPKNYYDDYYSSSISFSNHLWDEVVKRVLNPFDFRILKINDTEGAPSKILVRAESKTPNEIDDGWVEGEMSTSETFFKKLVNLDGRYIGQIDINPQATNLSYHFQVISHSERYTFPLNDDIIINFTRDTKPPKGRILLSRSSLTDPTGPKIVAEVWDNLGVDVQKTVLKVLLPGGDVEFTPKPISYDPISGRITVVYELPPLKGVIKVYLRVVDKAEIPNTALFPDTPLSFTVTAAITVALDQYRSDMREYQRMNNTIQRLIEQYRIINHPLTSGDLNGVDMYIVADPSVVYSEGEINTINDFSSRGGRILALLSPELLGEKNVSEVLGNILGIKVESGKVWDSLLVNTTLPALKGVKAQIRISGTLITRGAEDDEPLLYTPEKQVVGIHAISKGRGIILPGSFLRDQIFDETEDVFLRLFSYLCGPLPPRFRIQLEGGEWMGERYHITPGKELTINLTEMRSGRWNIKFYKVLWGDGEVSIGGGVFHHIYKTSKSFFLRAEAVDSLNITGEKCINVLSNYPPDLYLNISNREPESWSWVYMNATVYDRDGGVESINWDLGDGYVAEGEKVIHYYKSHGNYTVTVIAKDDEGVERIKEFILNVKNSPPEGGINKMVYVNNKLQERGSTPFEVNEGDDVLFMANGEDRDGDRVQFFWYINGVREGSGEFIKYAFNTSGVYDICLNITDAMGGVVYDHARVLVINLPPSPHIIIQKKGKEYLFKLDNGVDSPSDENELIVLWYFGDGKKAEGLQVSHSYLFGGKYNVKVVVKDPEGEVGVDSITLSSPGISKIALAISAALIMTTLLLFYFFYKIHVKSLKKYDGVTLDDVRRRNTGIP